MSKQTIKKPIIDLFWDLDETLVRNDIISDSPVFNGAFTEGKLGPWVKALEWPEQFLDLADLRHRVLTARPRITSHSFEIAKLLNLKPRLKSTGEEFESKKGEIYFAMYYPSYGRVYLKLDDKPQTIQTPCFVWTKQNSGSAMLDYFLDDQGHFERLTLTQAVVAEVHGLMDSSITNGLVDEEKHKKLTQTILKYAPVNRLIIFSQEGKVTSSTKLEDSDIQPAYCFTHIPKAVIMEKIRTETRGQVITSMLIDDQIQTHSRYLKKDKDLIIDASELQKYEFGSLELVQKVNEVIDDAESDIIKMLQTYQHYNLNISAFAPILTEKFNFEVKLNSFSYSYRLSMCRDYDDQILSLSALDQDSKTADSFLRLMLLPDDFAIFSNNQEIKSMEDEKESFNCLDPLLQFANLPVWSRERHHGSRTFSSAPPRGISQIRRLLKNDERDEQDYGDLIEILNEEVNDPGINLYPPRLIVFYHMIIKLDSLQTLEYLGFQQAAKIIIEEFRKELQLPVIQDSAMQIDKPSQQFTS